MTRALAYLLALAAAVALAAILGGAGPASAAGCANCENAGTGSCVCEDFEARDPNTNGDSPYSYLKECLTGSSPVVAAPPTGGLCWFLDTDCTTGSYQWTWRCPEADYQLNSFLSEVVDAEGFTASGWPHRSFQVSEDFTLDNPLTGRTRLSIAGGLQVAITETTLAGAPVCLSTAASVDCDSDNVWNVQYALGGRLQRDGYDAALQGNVLMQATYAPNTAAKRYYRWMPSSGAGVTTASDVELPLAAACRVRRVTVSLLDASTYQKVNLSAGTLKVGVRTAAADTELCTVTAGNPSNTCGSLSTLADENVNAAWYLDCPSCTDATARLVAVILGCQ